MPGLPWHEGWEDSSHGVLHKHREPCVVVFWFFCIFSCVVFCCFFEVLLWSLSPQAWALCCCVSVVFLRSFHKHCGQRIIVFLILCCPMLYRCVLFSACLVVFCNQATWALFCVLLPCNLTTHQNIQNITMNVTISTACISLTVGH